MSKYEKKRFKFTSAMKWGSYFFITTVIFSFISVFLLVAFPIASSIYLFSFLFIWIFFSFKCIKEVRSEFDINLIERYGLLNRVFVICFFLVSMLHTHQEFVIPRIKDRNFAVDEIELKNVVSSF